jgi:steroid delta-isomerase-like uncharacterized protein
MPTATAPTDVSNAELVRWAFDRVNAKDLDALKTLWTDDTVERFPDATVHGKDAIAEYFADKFRAFPDWHMEVVAVAEDGEHVFVQWRLTATHEGAVLGIAPTGKRVEIDGMDHFVIRDGRVVSNFVVLDQMQYARQIGMMPPDGSAADRGLKAAFNARTKLAERLGR